MRRFAATLALTIAVGGCGLGPGVARPGGVSLNVTRGFGSQTLSSEHLDRVRSSDTVMRVLESRRRVQTAYGGGFVSSIDGLAGDKPAQRDWFYYVNGSEADVGASDYAVSRGDVVQWDYHSWVATMHIPDIVGAFPEPFVHGYRGRRLPTRLECDDPTGAACRTVEQRFAQAGVVASKAVLGSVEGNNVITVVVGRWSAARAIGTLSTLTSGPASSGIFARFDRFGRRLDLLDAGGHAVLAAPPGTGLVAATAQPGGSTVWVVTGIDDAGVERAAGALNTGALRNAFAVALAPSREIRLPVGG